jgi:hypothetical protein
MDPLVFVREWPFGNIFGTKGQESSPPSFGSDPGWDDRRSRPIRTMLMEAVVGARSLSE